MPQVSRELSADPDPGLRADTADAEQLDAAAPHARRRWPGRMNRELDLRVLRRRLADLRREPRDDDRHRVGQLVASRAGQHADLVRDRDPAQVDPGDEPARSATGADVRGRDLDLDAVHRAIDRHAEPALDPRPDVAGVGAGRRRLPDQPGVGARLGVRRRDQREPDRESPDQHITPTPTAVHHCTMSFL